MVCTHNMWSAFSSSGRREPAVAITTCLVNRLIVNKIIIDFVSDVPDWLANSYT